METNRAPNVTRMVADAGSDTARLVDMLAAHPWTPVETTDLGRTLGDDPNPWPQPGTTQEIDWAFDSGLISRGLRKQVWDRIHAATAAR